MIPELQEDDNWGEGVSRTLKSSSPEDAAWERFWTPREIARLRRREPAADFIEEKMPHEKAG